ncbi:hypothetical protein MUG84_17520 [Paenibacillus sp. KQZ6P-2]|uniref:Uncharacterized protein n=1 Tax=Paenibacillus mangrovi TaxID=2931978 RepID=A0A9X1WQL7_9BACL|nr:hypothetical protein [Paenibacillus mangrovi]MCJ8013527.1 hypothetical protein [Paenibacillus mangrovi]
MFPTANIDFRLNNGHCIHSPECQRFSKEVVYQKFVIGRYLGVGQIANDQCPSALIPVKNLTYDHYLMKVKKINKGRTLRTAQIADKQDYYCKPFVREQFIPDIVEIHFSKEIRSGGPLTGYYKKSVEEMGGAPSAPHKLSLPSCPNHYEMMWGIFKPIPGYQQGSVVTNEKLLAYICLERIGNLAYYALIIGHGDYLNDGIMYRLHFAVMEWICNAGNPYSQGLDYIMYAGYYHENPGLMFWRKLTGFEAAYLVTDQSDFNP